MKINFRDVTMLTPWVRCHIRLSKFNERFERAQRWLDTEILKKMTPYVPYKTGAFLSRIVSANAARIGTGRVQTIVPPQGRYLYPGISRYGKPFNWTNPQTQPRWGSYTIRTYRNELTNGVRDIIAGKK